MLEDHRAKKYGTMRMPINEIIRLISTEEQMMSQKTVISDCQFVELDQWVRQNQVQKVMLVCDHAVHFIEDLRIYFESIEERLGIELVRFSDFEPNPLYESVVKGVELFNQEKCDSLMAVGGGSAIDVAKCIKLFSNLDPEMLYLSQEFRPEAIPFAAVPTTAGTGSESTRFAVIYYQGRKQSITSEQCIPDLAVLAPACLKTLPEYQRKATMMDAFCHALESFWSVNSTEESRQYSKTALSAILENMEGYLSNTESGNEGMLRAAHVAGKAINITQTTAGHAMCYKITSLFGCAHGHAAILCDRVLYRWMIRNTGLCIDPRGEGFLKDVLGEIAEAMGCTSLELAAERIEGLFESLKLGVPEASVEECEELVRSVNPDRLRNHPVKLTTETIRGLYYLVLNVE